MVRASVHQFSMAQHVKLRIIVADYGGEQVSLERDAQGAAGDAWGFDRGKRAQLPAHAHPHLPPLVPQTPKSCYNETLHDDCEWAQWEQRMASKLGGSPSFRFLPPASGYSSGPEESSSGQALRLGSDEDLRTLKRLYVNALKEQSEGSAKTFRICVIATPTGQQQHQRQQKQPWEHESKAGSSACAKGSGAGVAPLPPASATSSLASTPLRRQRFKVRRHSTSEAPSSAPSSAPAAENTWPSEGKQPGLSVARPDVFWDSVLRNIVNAIDRHSFASQLSAGVCAPSTRPVEPSSVHAVML